MSEKNKLSTVEIVWQIAQPIAERLGLEIWDIRFVKEGADWYLRVFIDKEEGVAIDDCEQMSRALDGPLDEKDPIAQAYIMEVSSPGIERELVRPEHFEKMTGQPVIVRLIRPKDGQKEFRGELKGLIDGQVVICTADGGQQLSFPKKEISAVLLDDFDDTF